MDRTGLDRRNFIELAGAFAALQILPACASRGPALASGPAGTSDTEAMLARIAEALLAEYPENATALGVDTGERASLKSRLTDRSLAGRARHAAAAAERLARLHAVDTAALDPQTRTNVEVVRTAHDLATRGFAFPYGDVVSLSQMWSYRNAPYVVAQNTGAFIEIPNFLDSNHKVETPADAQAYLARLEAYAGALDGETERLAHDAGLGVIAPAFLLDKTLKQMKDARALPIQEWTLVTSLARRTATMGGD
jgi:uncharacterized protein (DUF885 family)